MTQSLSDIAYRNLKRKRKEVSFNRLWKEVAEEAQMPENVATRKIASFYNALMLDSRFISLEDNKWDLRERHSLESLQIDPDLLESYDDYEEEFEEEYDGEPSGSDEY